MVVRWYDASSSDPRQGREPQKCEARGRRFFFVASDYGTYEFYLVLIIYKQS